MDIVVIVLLVLLGVIVLTKGKPLWNNWGKPLWSFLKQFNAKHPDVKIWVLLGLGGIWILWWVNGW